MQNLVCLRDNTYTRQINDWHKCLRNQMCSCTWPNFWDLVAAQGGRRGKVGRAKIASEPLAPQSATEAASHPEKALGPSPERPEGHQWPWHVGSQRGGA